MLWNGYVENVVREDLQRRVPRGRLATQDQNEPDTDPFYARIIDDKFDRVLMFQLQMVNK